MTLKVGDRVVITGPSEEWISRWPDGRARWNDDTVCGYVGGMEDFIGETLKVTEVSSYTNVRLDIEGPSWKNVWWSPRWFKPLANVIESAADMEALYA